MWKNQIILFLCLLHVGVSIAKSFRPVNLDYDYTEESRNAPTRFKGKSLRTTPRPLFQQYWQNFVRNLPTLPQFSWNMTNPLGNILSAGSQEHIETPIQMQYIIDDNEPHRRRGTKVSKRKSSKKSKNHLGSQSRYYYYDDNSYGGGYQQTQLQLHLLGLDSNRVMHFYDPSTGQYYSLQREAQPIYYDNNYGNQYNQYHSYAQGGYNSVYSQHGYESDPASHYSPHGYESDSASPYSEHSYDSDHNNYGDGHMEYDDSVEVVDNWGYNDDDIFADRKLKGGSENFNAIAGSIIKIQKHLLKPESADDIKNFLFETNKADDKNYKMTMSNEDNEKTEVESVRNVLGTFIKEDANSKITTRLIEKPKVKGEYYVIPANFWLIKRSKL